MNQKCLNSRKAESEIKNAAGKNFTRLRTIKDHGV